MMGTSTGSSTVCASQDCRVEDAPSRRFAPWDLRMPSSPAASEAQRKMTSAKHGASFHALHAETVSTVSPASVEKRASREEAVCFGACVLRRARCRSRL
eukprot:2506955-Pleurochrysis_carterae.AAC.1